MAAISIPPEEVKRLKGLGFISNKDTDNFSARVVTGYGRLRAEQLRLLAEAAERFGDGHVVFTTRLCAEIPGIPYGKIEAFTAFLNAGGMETGGTGARVRPVVSCKGTTCQYGQIDTYALAESIHERFYKGCHSVSLPHKFKIAVGGCPNNCVKPSLNDVGVMGWRGGYRLFIGGRWGKNHAIGQPLSRIFETQDAVLDAIGRAIAFYRDNGLPGERFCLTIERLGFETVEKAILGE